MSAVRTVVVGRTYFACNIAIGIEEAEWVVRATENSKADFGDIVVRVWCCFCPSKGTLVV